jgi:hypothetical protein
LGSAYARKAVTTRTVRPLYIGFPEPDSIGNTHHQLVLISNGSDRAACSAWASIARDDLIAQHLTPLTSRH